MIYLLHGNLGSPEDCLCFKSWFPDEECVSLSLWDMLEKGSTLESTGHKLLNICEEGATIMGYSLGGRLAMHALLARPSHWKGAVFVSAHFGLADEGVRQARLTLDREWARRCLVLSPEAFMEEWNAQPVFNVSERKSVEASLSLERISQAFDCWSLGRQAYLVPQLASCPTPWESYVGEHDRKFRDLWQEKFAQETKLVLGAGHRIIQHEFLKP